MKATCVWVGAALLCAASAPAQTDSSQQATLQEVIVTANKIPQKQSQTGKVVTVITKEQLQQQQAKTLAQILNEQAGITINGAQNALGTNQSVFMRGASSGRTLILVDGIPVYDPSIIGNEFDLNFISPGMVERVEVARGAQSTLYGSDAIGGVINIITTPANLNRPVGAELGSSFGSFGTYRGHANVYGKQGLVDYQVRYNKVLSEGFSAARDRNNTDLFDKDGFNKDAIQARVGVQATDALKVSAFVNHSTYRADIDAGAFQDDRDFTSHNRTTMAGAVADYKQAAVQMRLQYMYSQTERDIVNDSLHAPGFTKYSSDAYFAKAQFIEWYGSFRLSRTLQLLTGADYRHASMNNQFLSISSFGPFASSFRDTSLYMASTYASLLYEKKGLNIEGGARLNVHERDGTNATYTFNPSYQVDKHWRIFGSLASGFKAPSLFQLYSSFGNQNLEAEKSVNYEAGAAFTQKGKQLQLVFFHRDITNGIDFDNVNFTYFNAVRQIVSGLELEGSVQLGKKLQLRGNYTLLGAEDRVQSRLTTRDTSYSYLLRRPRHQAHVVLSYSPTRQLSLQVSALHVGERLDVGGFRVPDVSLDAYTIFGLMAQYKASEAITLFADGQNIFNTTFFDLNGFNSMGRNVQAGMRVKL